MERSQQREVYMIVAAWLDGRRDGEFWLRRIHETLGSLNSEGLKRLAQGAREESGT